MATKLTIGIAGAGTMGAGIAQVTAQAGHPTILFDLNEQVLAKAKDGLQKTLATLVSKQKITAETQHNIIGLITFTASIDDIVQIG